jgi:hypothetical protein
MNNNSLFVISNASTDAYPENTLTHFKNKLPTNINFKLNANWQVALESLGFSCQFRNVHLPQKPFPSFIISTCHYPTAGSRKVIKNKKIIEDIPCPADVQFKFSEHGVEQKAEALPLYLQEYNKYAYWYFTFEDKIYTQKDIEIFFRDVNKDCNTNIKYENELLSFNTPINDKKYWVFLHQTFIDTFNIVKEYTPSTFDTRQIKHILNVTKTDNASIGKGFVERQVYYNGEKYFAYQITKTDILKSQKSRIVEKNYPTLVKVVCNNIQPQILNNTYSRDLSVFCPDFQNNQVYYFHEFITKQFSPLSNSILTNLEIKLYDQNNSQLQLLPGHATIVKLSLQQMDFYTESFNLRLTSQITDKYPDNENFSFKMSLPRKLVLNRNWRATLTSINFPNQYNTFLDNESKRKITFFRLLEGNTNEPHEFIIPNDIYTKESLIKCLDDGLIENEIGRVTLDVNGAIIFTIPYEGIFYIPTNLLNIIGCSTQKSELDYAIYYFSEVPITDKSTIKKNADNMYVIKCEGEMNLEYLKPNYMILYADFVSPTIIGGKYSSILRVVPIKHSEKGYILHEFKHTSYLELNNTELMELEIQLKTHDGEFINFANNQNIILNIQFTKNKK